MNPGRLVRMLGGLWGGFGFSRLVFADADDFLQAILEAADEGGLFLRLWKAGGAHVDAGVG
jgi:hypothetical protein